MKYLIKSLAIVLFFTLAGYALTYPYNLSYEGEKDIFLIETSKEACSIKDILNRPEFKNKVLFVRVGVPLESEILIPKFDDAQTNKIIIHKNGKKQIIHSKNQPYYFQLQRLSELKEHYNNKEVALVFIDFPNVDSNLQEDNLRKWKATIKKYKIKGYHILINLKVYTKVMRALEKEKGISGNVHCNFLVNKKGEIINGNAPSPTFNLEKLYTKIDSLLAQ